MDKTMHELIKALTALAEAGTKYLEARAIETKHPQAEHIQGEERREGD